MKDSIIINLSFVCFLFFLGLSNSKAQTDTLQIDSLSIEFIGDANLQSVVSNNAPNTATGGFTATGGLGIIVNRNLLMKSDSKWRIFKEFSVDASINVTTSLDTLFLDIENNQSAPLISNLSEVGTFILLPSVTKQYATGTFVGYFNDIQTKSPLKKWILRACSGI